MEVECQLMTLPADFLVLFHRQILDEEAKWIHNFIQYPQDQIYLSKDLVFQ